MKMTNHLEQTEGEIFITNATSEVYPKVGWKSKRIGITAYDINGKPIINQEYFPVFAQIDELRGAGIDIVQPLNA